MDNNYDFYKRMAVVGEWIPYGKVASYGQIALLCGSPKNSRQVGYALRAGKVSGAFPAHRLVNGKGILSGAAAFAQPDMQPKMLRNEKVEVDSDNRIDLKKFGWHHTIDDAMELYELFKKLNI